MSRRLECSIGLGLGVARVVVAALAVNWGAMFFAAAYGVSALRIYGLRGEK